MKTISYGIMHFTIAFAVSYIMSGSFAIASAIALVEPIIQTFAYSIHERIWDNLKTNKKEESTQVSSFFIHNH